MGVSKDKLAQIQIGSGCSIGDRTEIHAGNNVTIGNEVIIAWDCVIIECDYYSVDGSVECGDNESCNHKR